MCNPNKGFKNCKPNRKVTQHRPQSLNEFVDRFCRHQLIHGVATCKASREMVVTPDALCAAYDKLLGESQ